MTGQDPIGVFDSGVGGLSVWREIVRRAPGQDTIYLADQAHVPYGSRSLGEVQRYCEGIARFLLDRGAQVIVVACNTASAAALYALRSTFPDVPFVGMEPAVKPAVERTRTGAVAVIATEATFQGELFASLLERYARDVEVFTQVCPGLVEAVEAGDLETPETEARLRACLAPLINRSVDQLVLGCTHYPFLRTVIDRVIGPEIAVIDPAPAVARQAVRVLASVGGEASGDGGEHLFFTSGDPAAFRRMAIRLLPEWGEGMEIRTVRWRGALLET